MTGNKEYAVLLSAASEMVYGPELVCPEIYSHAIDAGAAGQRIRNTSGLEFEVMRKVDGQWRNARGETPVQVIRRRWA